MYIRNKKEMPMIEAEHIDGFINQMIEKKQNVVKYKNQKRGHFKSLN